MKIENKSKSDYYLSSSECWSMQPIDNQMSHSAGLNNYNMRKRSVTQWMQIHIGLLLKRQGAIDLSVMSKKNTLKAICDFFSNIESMHTQNDDKTIYEKHTPFQFCL